MGNFVAHPCRGRVRVVQGDVTRQDVAAIVNAANAALKRGGGVDALQDLPAVAEVRFVCFDGATEGLYRALLDS